MNAAALRPETRRALRVLAECKAMGIRADLNTSRREVAVFVCGTEVKAVRTDSTRYDHLLRLRGEHLVGVYSMKATTQQIADDIELGLELTR